MKLHIVLFAIIQIVKTQIHGYNDTTFRRCEFCLDLQEPMGEDYDGPYPDQEEVSNLQKS